VQSSMWMGLMSLLMACKSGPSSSRIEPSTAAPPPPEPPGVTMHTIKGRVEQIGFQNINKAANRYSYNVELTVHLDSVEPTVDLWVTSPSPSPKRVQVRIHQGLGWSQLTAAEQATLAPDGPRASMSTQSWRGFVVGETAVMQAHSSGFDLFHVD